MSTTPPSSDTHPTIAPIVGPDDPRRFTDSGIEQKIVYDESDIPVACGSLTAIAIDLAHIASRGLPWILRRLPGGLSGPWNLRVLVCGLPISAGQHNLALTSRGSRQQIFAATT